MSLFGCFFFTIKKTKKEDDEERCYSIPVTLFVWFVGTLVYHVGLWQSVISRKVGHEEVQHTSDLLEGILVRTVEFCVQWSWCWTRSFSQSPEKGTGLQDVF